MTVGRNYLLLLLLIVSLVQLQMLSQQRGEYRVRDFEETLHINIESIEEVEMSNFDGNYVQTKQDEIIKDLINYLGDFQYKRLVNDETSYMPLKTRMIYFHGEGMSSFMIPYGNEVMIDNRVYVVKEGPMEDDFFVSIYTELIEREK